MSSVVPFNGIGNTPGGRGNNPAMNQLRRIKDFAVGTRAREAMVGDAIHVATVQHGHQVELANIQQGHQTDLISQAGRETRRNQTHAAKVHGELVGTLTQHGVNFSAPGTTQVSYGDLKVTTTRPKPPKAKATKQPKAGGTASAPKAPVPNASQLAVKFTAP